MTALHEAHESGCRGSYCGQGPFGVRPMRYGLNVPPAWRRFNAWWVIKYAPGRYLRWTWPRLLWASPRRRATAPEAAQVSASGPGITSPLPVPLERKT